MTHKQAFLSPDKLSATARLRDAAYLRDLWHVTLLVLTVGDIPFQRKCLERIAQFKKQGCAVVLVSHEAALVRQMCDQAQLRVKAMTGGCLATQREAQGPDKSRVLYQKTPYDFAHFLPSKMNDWSLKRR